MDDNLIKVAGVKFRSAGNVYTFNSGLLTLKKGDNVIVETKYGLSFGEIVKAPQLLKKKPSIPLKNIIRLAEKKDFIQLDNIKKLEEKAYIHCMKKIKELNLNMNFFCAQSSFDIKKMTFFYTAEKRVED